MSALLLQVVLIFLNAVFASAEIAVISVSDAKLAKLEEDGNKKAKKLKKLTENPANFLATIQIAITLSGFLASAIPSVPEAKSRPTVKGVVVPKSWAARLA